MVVIIVRVCVKQNNTILKAGGRRIYRKLFVAREAVYFVMADLHIGICAADHRLHYLVLLSIDFGSRYFDLQWRAFRSTG
jgi:hypothetical protein